MMTEQQPVTELPPLGGDDDDLFVEDDQQARYTPELRTADILFTQITARIRTGGQSR